MTKKLTQLDRLEQWQVAHQRYDEATHKRDDETFATIGAALTDIKDNHLSHLQISYEKISGDLWWVKWLVMGLVSGVGLIVVGVIVGLISGKL